MQWEPAGRSTKWTRGTTESSGDSLRGTGGDGGQDSRKNTRKGVDIGVLFR